MPPSFSEFASFLAADCRRAEFIVSFLQSRGGGATVFSLGGKRHIYVRFSDGAYNSAYRIKTVIAHYDRVAGSPGANDNSAAVFCLLEWAVRLLHMDGFHNVQLLFTDGEELGEHGVAEQGAYAVAALFRRLGLTHDDIYVFDCVGRGMLPVVGSTAGLVHPSYAFLKQLTDLEQRAGAIFHRAGYSRWLTLPLSYSDNAGFLACGIPAVVITLLPEVEANRYRVMLAKEKKLAAFVMRKKEAGCFDDTPESVLERQRLMALLPETWQRFHTAADSLDSLDAESFEATARILDALAKERTPA
ncbi:MAG: M28 family peptidase [Treponema sp.]|nr:M28 family peptidase [Treponema sp.]